MRNLIQSLFDKNTSEKMASNATLQTKTSEKTKKDEVTFSPASAYNHGIEVQELSFEDVARIMGGK